MNIEYNDMSRTNSDSFLILFTFNNNFTSQLLNLPDAKRFKDLQHFIKIERTF